MQVEIIQRQDELDQLLRQWGQSAASKQDFDEHTKSVMEYIDVVKSNAKMTCDNVKIEMKTLQQQLGMNESRQSKDLKKLREELTKRISEATKQHEALGLAVKTDVGKLASDMLGVVSNVNGLTTDVNGLNSKVGTLGDDLSKVANNVNKLESSIKTQNLQLQNSITSQIQNLFAGFKTSIKESVRAGETLPANPRSQTRMGDPSPAPRNVRYASSTQYETDKGEADTTEMAEMVHDIMEASNNRLHRMVETLQKTQAPSLADGMGETS